MAKLQFIMHRLVQPGIGQAKCSTTVELRSACAARIKDVLLAYPVVGANAVRVRELAAENPETKSPSWLKIQRRPLGGKAAAWAFSST
jgi:D-serine deaminase-like pyridoxal phosphate-dependent protein